jgi:CubicO group peptidase (beta-lactamase class C family)
MLRRWFYCVKVLQNKVLIYKMNRVIIFITSICFLFLASSFLNCDKADPLHPITRYPGAVAQNIDNVQLSQAIDKLAKIEGIKSIVLGRNGVIAAEEYYNDGGAGVIHDVRSVTKSVIGLLIGIAIQEGYIQSVDQTVGEFLIGTVIDSLEAAKAQISIEHLLTMSCGLEWHELDGGNSYNQWYWSGDYINWVLNQPFIHEPGNGFNYNTGSIHLLSVILTLATGETALDFARTYLFQPIGIAESDWTILPEDERFNNGGAGLKISPHAMFAIGSLVLNGGRWLQEQVVPSEWVTECTSIHNTTNNFNPYGTHYGYLWWIGQAHGHNHFFAMGWGGQFIICVPDHDLVVVATCNWSGVPDNEARQHWYEIFVIIMDNILTAVKE